MRTFDSLYAAGLDAIYGSERITSSLPQSPKSSSCSDATRQAEGLSWQHWGGGGRAGVSRMRDAQDDYFPNIIRTASFVCVCRIYYKQNYF